jgi:hypothetical protein
VLQRLASYDPLKEPLGPLLQEIVPPLAKHALNLGTSQLKKGAPLSVTFGSGLSEKLDESPGDLPLIVWQKEEGRLPGALIVARYRNALPHHLQARQSERRYIVRHPLVDQYLGSPQQPATCDGWPAGSTCKSATALYLVDMPFGAGLFGLRPSYAFGTWEFGTLPNGVAWGSMAQRPAAAADKTQYRGLKDKDDDEVALDDDYHAAREYRLSSLYLPDAEGGVVKHTVHLYFVRIVPALDEGTDLKATGALANWLFSRGAQDAVILPVKLIRQVVAQMTGK